MSRGRVLALPCLLCLFTAGLPGCGPAANVAKVPAIVTVAVPLEREISDYEYFTGRTAAVQSVAVRARVTGYLGEIAVKEGALVTGPEDLNTIGSSIVGMLASPVSSRALLSLTMLYPARVEGDLLFVIDQRPYQATFDQAAAQVTLNEARLERTTKDYDRNRPLVRTGGISQQELDKYLADRDEAAAALASSRANLANARLNLDFCRVTAPITGRISKYDITIGNLVNQNMTTLTNIVSEEPMYAYFGVDEQTMQAIQKMIREGKFKGTRQGGIVPVDMALASDNDYPHKGVINFVDNQVDPNTGTLAVRGVFPNKQAILAPGMFCRVRVPIGPPHKAVLVTERALGTDQGQKFVYVVDAKNAVQYRPVEIGSLDGGLREISKGLKLGERVIINGLQRVRPGVTVDPKPAEMQPGAQDAGAAKPVIGPEGKK